MKKGLLTMAGMLLTVSLVSAGTTVPVLADEETTLVYGSGDYTRINPAMDEHGEINILIFNGLTAHDGDNQVVPGLAESWEFDDATNTYTFTWQKMLNGRMANLLQQTMLNLRSKLSWIRKMVLRMHQTTKM